MPPKGSKGKSKSTETKAKSGEGSKKWVEDTLLMDQTKQKTPKLEETIEQLNLKNEKIKNITALVESFQVNAVDQFNPAHAIPLIMPKTLIKHGMYMTEVSSKTAIPILQVRDDAPPNWNLPAAGGQHHIAALEIWLEKKLAQLNEYVAKEHSIQKQDPDDVDKNELKQWNEGGKKEKDALEGIMAYEGLWLVSLFDDSMIDESLALHISQNEMKHVYMELLMDGLIQLFKIMKAQGSDYQQVKLVPQSKGNASKQTELLRQDYVWEMLSQFDTTGMHYWHANFMQFSEFYLMMMSSYGGMLAYLVGCLEKKLHICFNSVEVDEKAVKTLLLSLRSKKAKAAQEKLEQIFDELHDARPILEAIRNGIREAINECFNSCIANMSGIHEISNQSSADWATIFAQYALEVHCKIKEQVTILQERGDLDRLCTEVRHALKTCMIKSKIVFVCDTCHEDYASFPFMSRSMFMLLKMHLACIQSTIFEIVLILFKSYPAALHMEGQILAMNIPNHSISQLELLSIFGMSLTGAVKKSKPSIPRKGKAKAMANDDDDDDGEYIDVEGESSAEKDVDGEGDDGDEQSVQESADDDKHDVQVESREECLAGQERAKMEAEECAKSLEIEASQAFKVLNNSPKVSVPAMVTSYLPWMCKSKISSDAVQNSFQGQDLLRWHTWEWAAQIELETTDYQANRVSKELQQTMLLEKRKHPNKVAVTHTWPDGLTNDQPVMKVFDLDTELAHHNYTILQESQQSQLQQQALEDLVKVLNMNAYVQWCGLQVGDSDLKKCRSSIDVLEVVYHATEEGASKAFLQKCKFVVTSQYELKMSKVGTLNPVDSTSVPDANEPHHAEPAGTECATITDASTTHQSSENHYNILTGATGAEADHPSGNTDTQDCLMGDQETGKTSGGKGDDAMDNAGDMSMDKSLDMGSNSSDASSDAASAPPQISIPSPPPTAGAHPPDPPALHDSNDEIFHRTLSSDTKRSHPPSVQPSKKHAASKSLLLGDEETIQRSSLGLAPLHHAPPRSKQKLDGGAPSSGLLNVAEGDEDVSEQLG
ncbi:hypothetical protein EDC04DRAFT_2907669 [Pisolithus marmoratus]|nr:hypothetical protein EDC04DRAFT_2907669 [Pisolithus marmoratus]